MAQPYDRDLEFVRFPWAMPSIISGKTPNKVAQLTLCWSGSLMIASDLSSSALCFQITPAMHCASSHSTDEPRDWSRAAPNMGRGACA